MKKLNCKQIDALLNCALQIKSVASIEDDGYNESDIFKLMHNICFDLIPFCKTEFIHRVNSEEKIIPYKGIIYKRDLEANNFHSLVRFYNSDSTKHLNIPVHFFTQKQLLYIYKKSKQYHEVYSSDKEIVRYESN